MPIHLLDLNGDTPNRGTPALLRMLGPSACRWKTRENGEIPTDEADAWVLTGGPGSPHADEAWQAPLRAALRARANRGAPTLAICLGMEVLALALGAPVRLLARPRLGLHALRLTELGRSDALLAPLDEAPTFENRQWGVFAPVGTALALGPEGDCVAVRYAPHVLGVMFHPEADEAALRAAPELCGGEDPSGLDRVHRRVVHGFLAGVAK